MLLLQNTPPAPPKKMIFRKISLSLFFCFSILLPCTSQKNEVYSVDLKKIPLLSFPDKNDSPEIKKNKQMIFRQFNEEAEHNAKVQLSSNTVITFYNVEVPDSMDFLWLSARLSPVTKETVSSLNGISSADEKIEGKTLTVSSFSGIFVAQTPLSPWENLIYSSYIEKIQRESPPVFEINGRRFFFLDKQKFNSTLLLFFLDTNIFSPLDSGILTSRFGYRTSPITGKEKFHEGIDLAADYGAKVFSCKAGTVLKCGWDNIYGNFIIIQHYNGLTSLYAHLSKTRVQQGQKINSGEYIGNVGSTGASTGPHLHFELRKNNKPKNPEDFLKEFREN